MDKSCEDCKNIIIDSGNKRKPCRKDQIRNSKTGRCILKSRSKPRKKSKSKKVETKGDKILNPKTGRYVLKTGAIGKKILAEKIKNQHKIKPTLANGNCFYSAIYRSLRDKDLLKKFYKCIPELDSKKENEFIKKARIYISEKNSLKKDYKNLFDNIKQELKRDPDYKLTLKEIIKSFGDSRSVIKIYIKENKFENDYKNEFIEDIQDVVKKDKTYVGEIEVLNFIKSLEKCNINVYTDKKANVGDNSINLIVRYEHWEYI